MAFQAEKLEVNPRMAQSIIPLEPIQRLVQTELGLIIFGLAAFSWVFYKLFLRELSAERHGNLSRHFKNLAFHVSLGVIFFSAYISLSRIGEPSISETRALIYIGLLTLAQGAIVFVKVARIFVFEYLFISHMRVGVPLLLINLTTLTLSVVLIAWLVSEIFSIRLGPLVATSAVFSLVVGLALQETLGNLFSGVALQLDKPYEIGDWIEIQTSNGKLIGQVREITWRATVLAGIGDELITMPNRVVGNAQISNFASKAAPIARSQAIRLPYSIPVERARQVLARSLHGIEGLSAHPAPLVLVAEAAESWVLYKIIYFITDLGAALTIGDRVLTRALTELERARIPVAAPKIQIISTDAAEKASEDATVS